MNCVFAKADVTEFVKEKLAELLKKPELRGTFMPDDSLQEVGLSSMMYVNLIVQLEGRFDIVFDDHELNVEFFQSIDHLIMSVVEKLKLNKRIIMNKY